MGGVGEVFPENLLVGPKLNNNGIELLVFTFP